MLRYSSIFDRTLHALRRRASRFVAVTVSTILEYINEILWDVRTYQPAASVLLDRSSVVVGGGMTENDLEAMVVGYVLSSIGQERRV